MIKKAILLSVLAVSLTGCVVDPWDDGSRDHWDRNGHYDRDHKDRDWKNREHRDHRDWKRDRGDNRDWRRDRD
ncbi:hypothetical protein ACBP83_05555 [Acinetobacter pseudolwoffii]|uniref:hypothetical protein n=1 Tax=Acinetobacter pseudolwoffii TaxID=2053287 RepID=UPI0035249E7B